MMVVESASKLATEDESRVALDYPNHPHLLPANESFQNNTLARIDKGVIFTPPPEIAQQLGFSSTIVDPDRIRSQVPATMYGLGEALVRAERGHILRDQFEHEMDQLTTQYSQTDNFDQYGTWVYYPRNGGLLTQFAPASMHRLALIASNSSLYLDPQQSLSFETVQDTFRQITPLIIGLSVGSNITKAINQSFRPDNLILADPALYKMTNLNRVLGLLHNLMTLSEEEMTREFSLHGLRNKAAILAEQLHAEDPYTNIFCYQDGATPNNLATLFTGTSIQPPATISIDVSDHLKIKLASAEEARKHGIRHIRATDAGTSVYLDIRHFDLDQNLPLSIWATDEELYRLLDQAEQSGEKHDYFAFAKAFVGPHHLSTRDEFPKLIYGRIPKTTASIPQLGATTMVAGGWTANLVARMALGHSTPESLSFNMRTNRTNHYGKTIPGMKLK